MARIRYDVRVGTAGGMNSNPCVSTISYGCGMPDEYPWIESKPAPTAQGGITLTYPQPTVPTLAGVIECIHEACGENDHETFRRLVMRLVKKEMGR